MDSTSQRVSRQCMATESINGEVRPPVDHLMLSLIVWFNIYCHVGLKLIFVEETKRLIWDHFSLECVFKTSDEN